MATTLTTEGQQTVKFHVGNLGKAAWTNLQTETGEVREKILKDVKLAAEEPFPDGPFPFNCLQKGWVKMRLQKDHGVNLKVKDGFQLELDVPQKKFRKVTVERESWNKETNKLQLDFVSEIYLNG